MATTTSRVIPAARLEKLWKRYPDGTVALADVTLDVGAGERVLVTGPTGSGTSTLLRVLSGRSVPTGGRARILGVASHFADQRSLLKLRSKVALLDGALHVPGQARVAEAVGIAASKAQGGAHRPHETLDALGGPAPTRMVGDLDAAERAVLALVLVAVRRPRLVVADDPWQHLDPGLGLALGAMACRVAGDSGAAFVLSGRDAGALDGMDRAVRLRDGRVVAS